MGQRGQRACETESRQLVQMQLFSHEVLSAATPVVAVPNASTSEAHPMHELL